MPAPQLDPLPGHDETGQPCILVDPRRRHNPANREEAFAYQIHDMAKHLHQCSHLKDKKSYRHAMQSLRQMVEAYGILEPEPTVIPCPRCGGQGVINADIFHTGTPCQLCKGAKNLRVIPEP